MIREATSDDAEQIANVHIQSWKTTYKGIITEKYNDDERMSLEFKINQWQDNIQNKESVVFIVEKINIGIIGFAHVINAGELCAIYILKEYQQHGLGTKIFQKSIDWLKEKRCTTMILWCFENHYQARKWYEHLGGKLLEVKSNVILCNNKYNKVCYQWEI